MNRNLLHHDQLSDEALAELVASGDVDAFDAIYRRHVGVVYGMAAAMLGRSEAEEVVQEVFFRYWKRADRYDPNRGPFRPWFITLARNQMLNLLRVRGHTPWAAMVEDLERLFATQADPQTSPESSVVNLESRNEMRDALGQLPIEQREVLFLSYFGGLSQSQIAAEMQLPLGTVKKRTRLALRKLRNLLVDCHVSSPWCREKQGEGKAVGQ